jgi:uncharacterized protein (DUF433 family)
MMRIVSGTIWPPPREHVTCTPGVCGGRPCIAGHRIRVQDVYVWQEVQGQTPAQMVADFPQLTVAQVHAALAYYWDNRELTTSFTPSPHTPHQSRRHPFSHPRPRPRRP